MPNQDMVREFHARIRAHVDVEMSAMQTATSQSLEAAAIVPMGLANEALARYREVGDPRDLRAHLMLEELGEALNAMAERDRVLLADALADLLYVVYGTAVTFGIPLDAVFTEVHRSNMTKEPQPSDPDAARVRDKGPNYSPPDIGRVLREAGKL